MGNIEKKTNIIANTLIYKAIGNFLLVKNLPIKYKQNGKIYNRILYTEDRERFSINIMIEIIK